MSKSLEQIAESSNELGLTFLQSKQYEEALKCFNDAIDFCPNKIHYYLNRSQCYIELWRYKEAIGDTVACIKLDNNQTIGLEMQVKCHIAFGALLEANVCLTIISNVRPKSEFVVFHRKLVHRLLSLAETYKRCVKNNDYSTALNSVNELLQHVTRNIAYKLAKAQILNAMQRYLDAEIVAKEVLLVEPRNDSALAIVKYTEHCIHALRANICEPEITEVIMEDVEDIKHSKELNEKAKKLTEKSQSAESAIKREKEVQIQELKDRATVAFKDKCYQICYNLYLRALRVDPSNDAENAKLYFNKSVVASKVRLEKTEEAINSCTDAIILEPKYFKAFLRRAKLYFNEQRFEEAVRDYEMVVQMEPGNEEYSRLLKEAKLCLTLSQQTSKNANTTSVPFERFLETGASFLNLTNNS
ncbi:dnaJ subfamily C member 7-like isoform X2 [Leptotrombidium deliense]|uniref:DnaJ subfamily C member 7-like isoform X2 n=1 Tax=Leptotrombidium deliense TaxID=299467 RepID=A0A443SGU2_9ACAR|nr:dnaJ subfamily C member 7-like isoform X2 [Leptotrombidium deliense]